MEDTTGFSSDELLTTISKDGESLTLIARRIEQDQWELAVQNADGICSTWLEHFPTAQKAIEVGLNAINEEGIEPFVDIDGFEYLHEENV